MFVELSDAAAFPELDLPPDQYVLMMLPHSTRLFAANELSIQIAELIYNSDGYELPRDR